MSLFKTTAEIKRYAPQFSKSISFDTLLPLVELSEITYIIPVIGRDFFDELDEAYNAEEDPSDEQIEIISRLQRSLAFYVAYESAKNVGVQITDAGVMESQPDKAGPARQWTHNMSLASSIETADRFLDVALMYLETHSEVYATWTSSDEYTVSKKYFINKTSELAKYVIIGDSRRAFLQIRTYIEVVEEKYIIPAIGEDLFNELKTQILAGTLTTLNKTLVNDYIKRPVAHLSFLEAAPNMILEVRGQGLRVLSSSDGLNQSNEANDKGVTFLLSSNKSNGDTYLARMKKYIEDNASDYPLYLNSSYYANNQPRTSIRDNSGKKSFMV